MPMRRRCLLLLLSLTACGTEREAVKERAGRKAAVDEGACAAAQDSFDARVWPKVLQPRCLGCHAPNKLAAKKGARFVLRGDGRTEKGRRENLQAFASMARRQVQGQPWVLLKPSGQTQHGGGTVIGTDSEAYGILAQFVATEVNLTACGDDP
jgi:hypothetical protein